MAAYNKRLVPFLSLIAFYFWKLCFYGEWLLFAVKMIGFFWAMLGWRKWWWIWQVQVGSEWRRWGRWEWRRGGFQIQTWFNMYYLFRDSWEFCADNLVWWLFCRRKMTTSKLMTRSGWGCEDEVMGNLVWNCLDCCNHLHF